MRGSGFSWKQKSLVVWSTRGLCRCTVLDDIPTADFYRLKAFFATVQIPRPEPGDIYQIGGSLPAPFYRHAESRWAERERNRYQEQVKAATAEIEAIRQRIKDRVAKTRWIDRAEQETG